VAVLLTEWDFADYPSDCINNRGLGGPSLNHDSPLVLGH